MKRILALACLLALAGCHSFGRAWDGLYSPQTQDDVATVKADFAAWKSTLPPTLLVDAETVGSEIAAGNWPGAALGIFAIVAEVQAAAPESLPAFEKLRANVERLIDDATGKAISAKAKAAIQRAQAARAVPKAPTVTPPAPSAPLSAEQLAAKKAQIDADAADAKKVLDAPLEKKP